MVDGKAADPATTLKIVEAFADWCAYNNLVPELQRLSVRHPALATLRAGCPLRVRIELLELRGRIDSASSEREFGALRAALLQQCEDSGYVDGDDSRRAALREVLLDVCVQAALAPACRARRRGRRGRRRAPRRVARR